MSIAAAPAPTRIGRDRVRELLQIAVWQYDLAVKTGLLTRGPDGKVDLFEVRRAQRSKEWMEKLESEYRLNASDAAARLQVSVKTFQKIIADSGVQPVETGPVKRGTALYWRAADIDRIAAQPGRKPGRARQTAVADLAAEFKVDETVVVAAASRVGARIHRVSGGGRMIASSHLHAIRGALHKPQNTRDEVREIEGRVKVAVRDRNRHPETVRIHLGPTNSGKTFHALQRLAESGHGTYAAPLRMLAREAYTKLAAQLGEENVGLITGEEEWNPDAPILCCTAEMAPDHGRTLVLDEAHWAEDEDRGYAWTRLLVGADYDIVEVAASRGAEPFLRSVFEGAPDFEVIYHERLSPLSYCGDTTVDTIPSKSLLVAFSRKGVHALASRLMAAGRTVGVLYGALPPENRVEQIESFISGKVEVMVTTDVIGHGINIPAENVVFAETSKFDGRTVRDLLTWEAAQIAGRAGRFGLADAGKVYTLRGQTGFNPKQRIVELGAEAAAGKAPDGMDVRSGLIRPKFTDLGNPEAHQIGVAMGAWNAQAVVALKHRRDVAPVPAEPFVQRFLYASDVLGLRGTTTLGQRWPIPGSELWKVITAPVDTDSDVFAPMVRTVASGSNKLSYILKQAKRDAPLGLEEAERAAGIARDVMVVARCFPELVGHLHGTAVEVEQEAAKTITAELMEALRTSSAGFCADCGQPCAPHFRFCDTCFAA
ncbi:helicase-related protein [Leifsonia sp. Leaf264]|uniref:helicase-related protein n=1 Tax=Leifsonia sp. Leaf264 TaxID=1736314 RepID=UPI0007019FC7|nr:helicase-related protein [Leifsonia sp. Leaf264]KQO98172.1 hypothetical protein ASF30_08920 [Leifsonia sp. Leaf264]